MDRFENLNNHLKNLAAVNTDGEYDDDIRSTVDEINKELGIGTESILSSYSTKELHNELVKRTGVVEITVDSEQEEAVFIKIIGDQEEKTAVKGPAKVIVNQE